MRRVRIVEKPNETYSYAAVDKQTGEVPLRLRDRHALVALCQRLGWTVEEKSKSARETRPKVGEATKFISPRKHQQRSHVGK